MQPATGVSSMGHLGQYFVHLDTVGVGLEPLLAVSDPVARSCTTPNFSTNKARGRTSLLLAHSLDDRPAASQQYFHNTMQYFTNRFALMSHNVSR
jgi:hypothetical protein